MLHRDPLGQAALRAASIDKKMFALIKLPIQHEFLNFLRCRTQDI